MVVLVRLESIGTLALHFADLQCAAVTAALVWSTGGMHGQRPLRPLPAADDRLIRDHGLSQAALVSTYFDFTVSLQDVLPRPWRRFLITRSVTFAALHSAIQDACGWANSHLYQFRTPVVTCARRWRV